jgi:phage terminase large subunit-like protein
MSAFKLTPKQNEAQAVFASGAKHILLVGGSRSGKTFLMGRNMAMRSLKAPNSRHAMFRYRFNSIKSSVVLDTFPKMMRLAFPGVDYTLDKTDWYVTFPNGSQLWFGGLDDKERTEKILGMEFATIGLNECSQIPYASRNVALTRLAQSVEQVIDGQAATMPTRMFYDENPPSKAHWTYKLFVEKKDPDTGEPVKNPEDYAYFFMNPRDNMANISADYIETLEGLPARQRARFLEGKFGDAISGQLFDDVTIDTWRVTDGILPEFVRVVVAVDPSGAGDADNADNDAIGICVVGLGVDGNAYVLEDNTVKAGPKTWGGVVASAFDRQQADCVVGEINYGGAMVNHVVQTARPRTPFRQVTASRGKHVRAEPFSALYEQGKVRHVGRFAELEGELTAFTTNGYMGSNSPNRADALIWALAELFPSMVRPPKDAAMNFTPLPRANKW